MDASMADRRRGGESGQRNRETPGHPALWEDNSFQRLPVQGVRLIALTPGQRQTVRTQIPASKFTTRMTTREQGTSDSMPSWVAYHPSVERRFAEGTRAIEQIARTAVDSSDELDFYPEPRPLLVGGHDQYAARLGPKTRMYEEVRGAKKSRWTGQDSAAGLRRDQQNFYNPVFFVDKSDADNSAFNAVACNGMRNNFI